MVVVYFWGFGQACTLNWGNNRTQAGGSFTKTGETGCRLSWEPAADWKKSSAGLELALLLDSLFFVFWTKIDSTK